MNHNFLQQSIFAFGIVELLLILLHFSDLVYIGIGTKNERQIEEVIYCFDCDVYDRKLEDEKFLYSKAIILCLSDYCVVSFAQKEKIKIMQKA